MPGASGSCAIRTSLTSAELQCDQPLPSAAADRLGAARGAQLGKDRRDVKFDCMLADLQLRNFRCFESLGIEFAPGFNFLVGQNGQGKTSILEAACVLLQ